MSFLSFIRDFSSILIATFSLVNVCVANFTFPNVPLPSAFPKKFKLLNETVKDFFEKLLCNYLPST